MLLNLMTAARLQSLPTAGRLLAGRQGQALAMWQHPEGVCPSRWGEEGALLRLLQSCVCCKTLPLLCCRALECVLSNTMLPMGPHHASPAMPICSGCTLLIAPPHPAFHHPMYCSAAFQASQPGMASPNIAAAQQTWHMAQHPLSSLPGLCMWFCLQENDLTAKEEQTTHVHSPLSNTKAVLHLQPWLLSFSPMRRD